MPDILYSTRDLSLLWFPPGWADAVLHGAPPAWYYRCDLAFLAWAEAVALKMGSALSPQDAASLDFIRLYVYALNGITDDTPDRIPTPGGKLPLAPQIEALSIYDAHCGPDWPGMSQLAAHIQCGTKGADTPHREGADYEPTPRLRTIRG